MDTIIINNCDEFNNNYKLLKQNADTKSIPATYLVGFDIEFFSKANYPESFKKAHKWLYNLESDQVTCLIQIATKNLCFIIMVKNMPKLPSKLINIIKNDSWIKVGVGIENDLAILSQNYNLGHCMGAIEIKNIALLANFKKQNLEYLFNKLIGAHIKKTSSICDWSKELTKDQLEYAARDAIMSLQLFNNIMEPTIKYLEDIDQNSIQNNLLSINIIGLNNSNKKEKIKENNNVNYIGMLNNISQELFKNNNRPVYNIDIKDDEPRFECKCIYNGNITTSRDTSKKKAKELAAKKMLELNGNITTPKELSKKKAIELVK